MTSITVVVPAFQVSYEEVDVTEDMLVRDLKAELEVLTDLPIGVKFNYHQSLEFRHADAFDLKENSVFTIRVAKFLKTTRL
jgi:hypothetical protein